MTCSECLEWLLTADIRPLKPAVGNAESEGSEAMTVAAHVAGCEKCSRALAVLRAAEAGLSESLLPSGTVRQLPETLAEYACRRVRRERLLRWTILPVMIALFVLATVFLTTTFGTPLKRLLTPPPAVETETFTLRCLSGEQAASLLRPYLPLPENPMWQAERFDVRPAGPGIRAVTVRAPHTTLALVPSLLARFEREARASCQPGTPG
jgi:anti-sigma factor RsiW